MRPKSFCKIWLRKCVHNTLMLVLVGVGLQEQLADIATTQVRNARLVPKYSAKVRRALGILQRSAAHTKWPHPLDHFSGNASQLARCGPRTSVQSAQLAKVRRSSHKAAPTKTEGWFHPQKITRLEFANLWLLTQFGRMAQQAAKLRCSPPNAETAPPTR